MAIKVRGLTMYLFSMLDETLSKTVCFAAKVATEPSPESAVSVCFLSSSLASAQSIQNHVIAVYVPDSWDKEAVAKVGKALVEDLEFNVSAFKPDIYSYADISSKQ